MSLKADEKEYLGRALEHFRKEKVAAIKKTADPNQLGREERVDHAPNEYTTFPEGEVDTASRWEKDERYETGHPAKIQTSSEKAALENMPDRERRFLRKKAALTVKVAGLMLPNGNETAVENQAVDLMAMPTKSLVTSFNRLTASRTALKTAAQSKDVKVVSTEIKVAADADADTIRLAAQKAADAVHLKEAHLPHRVRVRVQGPPKPCPEYEYQYPGYEYEYTAADESEAGKGGEKEKEEDELRRFEAEEEKVDEKEPEKEPAKDAKKDDEGMDSAEAMLDEALLLDDALEVDDGKKDDEKDAAKAKKEEEEAEKDAKKPEDDDEKDAKKPEDDDEKDAKKPEEMDPMGKKSSEEGGEMDSLLAGLTKGASDGIEDADLDAILQAAVAPEGQGKTASAAAAKAVQKLNRVKREQAPVDKEEAVLARMWDSSPDVSEFFKR